MNNKFMKGFTLIEMMIVVAILGIVSAIAYPSYAEYVKKGKRTDAKVELLRIAQLQESYFVQNLSYAKDLTIGAGGLGLGAAIKSEQEEYTITIDNLFPTNCTGLSGGGEIPCTEYRLEAEGIGEQGNDKCGMFTLSHTGARGVDSPATGYDTKKCWK